VTDTAEYQSSTIMSVSKQRHILFEVVLNCKQSEIQRLSFHTLEIVDHFRSARSQSNILPDPTCFHHS
jgi:hypothetical protein